MTITVDPASKPIAQFIFAHGAGAGKDSGFMQGITRQLVACQITVVRFNFVYMQKAMELGKRRPPDRAPKLVEYFEFVLEQVEPDLPLFIGGKSMGGRIASMLFEHSHALGCICLGYPFHPPAKPDKLRTEHFQKISKPMLILQGQRDTFGTEHEINTYSLPSSTTVEFLTDGDHSFKPRKSSGTSLAQNLDTVVELMNRFIRDNL